MLSLTKRATKIRFFQQGADVRDFYEDLRWSGECQGQREWAGRQVRGELERALLLRSFIVK